MIKLVKHSLTPAARFEPESCQMTLSEKDSQIVITLGIGDAALEIGDWLQENVDPGAGTVWRVKTIETDYQTRTVRVTAEHILRTMADTVIFGTVTADQMGGSQGVISAAGAIAYALAQCPDWQVVSGSVGYNVTLPYEFNGDTVWEAVETVCSTLEDPWWSCDLSSYPFTLSIQPRSAAAACEMREERNISTLRKQVDISRMYTRIYPVGKEDLHIEGNYLSRNEGTYGVISKVETDQSKEDAGMLQAWAAARLARHCTPSVTITITGADLSLSTGEPLDHLQVGVGCRVPLPEFGTTILDTITRLQWRDKVADPESVTVTLSTEMEDVASIMRREIASGSGTSGRGGRTGAKQAKEDHAWFVDTEDHVAMVAEAIAGQDGQGNPNWSRVSTLTVDGNGIDSRVTTTEGGLVTAQSAITQTEHSVSMSVGTLKGVTLESYPKKKNFPTAGAGNKVYLDQSTGIYWVYVNGEYKRCKFATDGNGNPITDGDGKIAEVHFTKAGEIAIAINEQGDAEAHIDAKKVILGKSELTADDLEQWAIDGTGRGSGVFAEFLTVRELTAQEIRTMLADIENAYVEDEMDVGILCVDTLKVDVNGENYSNVSIYDASVASNVLTIYCTNGQNINFSKATSLSATWTGDNTTAQATFAISATQSNKNTTTGQIETVEVATDQASTAAKTTTIEVKQSKAAAYVVTVGASGGKSDGAIIARIDNPQYGNGWTAACGKIHWPGAVDTSGTEAEQKTFVVKYPNATPDTATPSEMTFTMTKGATPGPSGYASVLLGQTGVARIPIGDWYTAGNANRGAAVDGCPPAASAPSSSATNKLILSSLDTWYLITPKYQKADGSFAEETDQTRKYYIKTPAGAYETPTITYDSLTGTNVDDKPGFTATANGKSKAGYLTLELSSYSPGGQGRFCVVAKKENTTDLVGRLDIQSFAVGQYMAGVNDGGAAATPVTITDITGKTNAGALTPGTKVGVLYTNSSSQTAYQSRYWTVSTQTGYRNTFTATGSATADVYTKQGSNWVRTQRNVDMGQTFTLYNDSHTVRYDIEIGGSVSWGTGSTTDHAWAE